MGIRIHKVLGYGITDLKTKDGNKTDKIIVDERINKNGFLMVDYEQREKWKVEDYLKYIIDHEKEDEYYDAEVLKGSITTRIIRRDFNKLKETVYNIDELVIYDWEYGMPQVVVFVPITHINDWTRYDDVIDYYDSINYGTGSIENEIKILSGGIFPYSSINSKTNKKIIPFEIRMLCKYLKIFVDDKYIDDLEPVLYSYWC